jgi:hypothetical protein
VFERNDLEEVAPHLLRWLIGAGEGHN